MSNTITNVVPLLLAQGLKALRQNAIMPQLVNKDYQGLAAQKGNVINIPIPSAITATNVTPSNTYASNVDTSPTVALVTLDFWKEATFQLSDKDVVSVMDGFVPMQASEAIKSLANAIDTFILGKHVGIFGLVGTPGTSPFNGSLTMAAQARQVLNQQLAPIDNRRAVIDPVAEANLLLNTAVLQWNQSGENPAAILTGTIGTKLGLDWYMDQNISKYTPGAGWASGNIASTLGGVVGNSTLNIINATASGAIKIGDIFTLTADSAAQQYVVTAGVTIAATTQVVISFYPPLKTTVATGATMIVVSVPYTVNLAFHRDAFAWASRPLMDIQGLGNPMMSVTDPITGIALRLEVSRQYRQTTFSYDVLGGCGLVRPELACKVAGQ